MNRYDLFVGKIVNLMRENKSANSKQVLIEAMSQFLQDELKISREYALAIAVKAYQEA